jgi:hypothetical protein
MLQAREAVPLEWRTQILSEFMAVLSLLKQDVDIVDTQRRELFVWALEFHQETTKGSIDIAAQSQYSALLTPKIWSEGHSHDIQRPGRLFKPIDLPKTHVVPHIRQRSLARLPPPLFRRVLASIQVESRGEQDLNTLARGQLEEVRIDVEGECCAVVLADCFEALDTVVLASYQGRRWVGGEREGIGVEL